MHDFQEIFAKNSHLIGEAVIEIDQVKIIMGIDYDEFDYYWVLRDLNGSISYTSMVVPLVEMTDVPGFDFVKGLFELNDVHRDFPMLDTMLQSSRCMEFVRDKPTPIQTWVAYKNFEAREFPSEQEARNYSSLVECVNKNCEEIKFYDNVLKNCWVESLSKYRSDLKKYLEKWFGDRADSITDRRLTAALELADLVEDYEHKSKVISNYMKYTMIIRAGKND